MCMDLITGLTPDCYHMNHVNARVLCFDPLSCQREYEYGESGLILDSSLNSCLKPSYKFSQVLMQFVGNMYKIERSSVYPMDHQP
jgi:hypothetical protein